MTRQIRSTVTVSGKKNTHTYASFYHSEQHFSLLRLTNAIAANCLLKKRMAVHV
jgi:hypothetical protein